MAVLVVAFNGVVVGVLPGWLLLRAIGWPRSQPERLLAAGPTSLAVVALLAALLGVADLAPSLPWLIGLDVLLMAAAWWRRGTTDTERLPLRLLLLGALPGLVLTGLAVQAIGGLNPPPAEDSLVHGQLVRWFLDGHAAPPYLVDHVSALRAPETRYGWHVFAASLVRGAGIDPARAVILATWPVIALLPGGVMLMLRRAGCSWFVAWLGGIACLGVGIVPFRILALGQSPLLCGGYAVAPVAAVALSDAIRSGRVSSCIAAATLVAGVVYIHPSDLPTVALLTATVLLAVRPFPVPTRRRLLAFAATGAAIIAMAIPWTRYRAQPIAGTRFGTSTSSAIDAEQFFTPRHLDGFASDVLGAVTTSVHDFALPCLAVAALVLAWRRSSVQAFLGLGIVLLALQVDAWGWQWPARALSAVFPWSTAERLLYLDWFVLAPLGAIGVAALATWLASVRRQPQTARALAVIGLTIVVLPVIGLAPAMLAHAEGYQMALTPADEEALRHLDGIVPSTALILTDGTADGGAWITTLTNDSTLLSKDWAGTTADADIQAALRGLCSAGTAARLEHFGVTWVYLGVHVATADGLADRTCPGGTAELEFVRLPGAGAEGPWLYRVVTAGGGATSMVVDRRSSGRAVLSACCPVVTPAGGFAGRLPP
jgi:hypothetical protein